MAKELSCRQAGTDCGFLNRSEDAPALLGFVQAHRSDQHDVGVAADDLRDRMGEG